MNRLLPLFALLLAFGVTACAEEPEPADVDVAVVDPAPIAEDTMMTGDMAPEVTLDGTIAAVPPEGITAIPAAAALDNINGWIAQLEGAEFTNAAEIREGLMTLRDQLQEDPLNGAAIGETLTDLGTWTAESAPDNEQIQTLASALTSGGEALTGSM